jgi:hypothetical protein
MAAQTSEGAPPSPPPPSPPPVLTELPLVLVPPDVALFEVAPDVLVAGAAPAPPSPPSSGAVSSPSNSSTFPLQAIAANVTTSPAPRFVSALMFMTLVLGPCVKSGNSYDLDAIVRILRIIGLCPPFA